jgi:hypothetical protein
MRVPKKNWHPESMISFDSSHFATKLSSRPEESWACGPPKVMKNTFCPPIALLGSIALPFVIPSVAEGSAVPRTIPGNVFRQSAAKWRDLLLTHPASNPNGSAPPLCHPECSRGSAVLSTGSDAQGKLPSVPGRRGPSLLFLRQITAGAVYWLL